jgi:hypothetical protein
MGEARMTQKQAKELADYMASKEPSVEAAAMAFAAMAIMAITAAVWSIL